MDKNTREILDELKAKLPINQYALDVECRNQAALLEEVGELTAAIRKEAKVAKEHVEYVKADLANKIRKNPEKYGLTKTTDSAVSSAVILQKEYQEAVKKMLDLTEEAECFSTLLTAVEQRKSLIRDAVSLFIHQYYSSQELTSEESDVRKVTEEQIISKRIEKARARENREDD